jgi:hypothetical protein
MLRAFASICRSLLPALSNAEEVVDPSARLSVQVPQKYRKGAAKAEVSKHSTAIIASATKAPNVPDNA